MNKSSEIKYDKMKLNFYTHDAAGLHFSLNKTFKLGI
jgi:hypothetical protein